MRTKIDKKSLQLLVIILLVLAIVGIVMFLIFRNQRTDEIPQSVQRSYVELGAEYQGSFGAAIQKCSSDKGQVYVVSGSGGYTGKTYYYDLTGKELGTYESSDLVIGSVPKPPVEVNYDSCKIVKSSKGAAE